MSDWRFTKVEGICDSLLKEETRQFAVVYGVLEDKYHGYLQELPQKTQVWHEALPDEDVKKLKEKFGWNKISVFRDKTWFTVNYPYLTLAGHLAMLHDNAKKVCITTKLDLDDTIPGKLWINATVEADNVKANALAEVGKDKDGNFEDTEKALSQAVRKAINLMGYGRFPIYTTDYANHPDIVAYKTFLKERKKN